ncbi:MAG: alpha/beta hydrolase family protein [Actinomycetota bacterium]
MTRSTVRTSHGEVSVAIDGPRDASTTVVLGHGAGSGMDGDYMAFFASGLAGDDRRVVRFNFPYMEQGRKSPDKQPVSERVFQEVGDFFRTERLVLGGKSYGGRIASHAVAAEEINADGLVFLGYPLHPPGRPDRIRDAHLHEIECPMLFVEGTRDPFCPLETLEGVRKALSAPTEVVVIEDGDHSLKVRKSSGRSTKDAWTEAVAAIEGWLAKL